MASLAKVIQISRSINNVTKLITNLSLSSNTNSIATTHLRKVPLQSCALLHTSLPKFDLMEFFDDKKNWGKTEVKVGRNWKKEELRLKSNEDLHKLWFVLLKERNMLLTMEEACKRAMEIFPNPERIDKVEMSMANIESTVRERNKAYHLLETGETGERPGKLVSNIIGMRFFYRMRQYTVPKFMNSKWHKTHLFGYNGYAVRKFLSLYKEKIWNVKRRERNRQRKNVLITLKRFPHVNDEVLQEMYPLVNVKAVRQHDRARGHFEY